MKPLAIVNGTPIAVEEAIRLAILHEEKFFKGAMEAVLIRQYAARENITNSDQELQVAADELNLIVAQKILKGGNLDAL